MKRRVARDQPMVCVIGSGNCARRRDFGAMYRHESSMMLWISKTGAVSQRGVALGLFPLVSAIITVAISQQGAQRLIGLYPISAVQGAERKGS